MYNILDLEQRSEEWKAFRQKHVMASDAPIIYGVSKYEKSYSALLEEKIKGCKEIKKNASVIQGLVHESSLLELFNEELSKRKKRSVVFKPVVAQKQGGEFPRGASLDGWCEECKEAVEIKVTNRRNQEIAENGKIPTEFYPQVQHQMEVLGLQEIWYVSYYIPSNSVRILKAKRDEDFISALLALEVEFWKKVEGGNNDNI